MSDQPDQPTSGEDPEATVGDAGESDDASETDGGAEEVTQEQATNDIADGRETAPRNDGVETEDTAPDAGEPIAEIVDAVITAHDIEIDEIATGGSVSENERVLTPVEESEYEDLTQVVGEEKPETVARALSLFGAGFASVVDQLTEERERADELESRLRRKQAEFQNYKKRQKDRLEEEKQRATEDLVTRLLDVRDNLQRALDQDEDVDIRDGVESTLQQFDQQLERENVQRIEPNDGEEVDPQRHEVLATVESEQPTDAIAECYRPGYEMSGKVIRPAQVTVSAGSEAENDDPAYTEEGPKDEGDQRPDGNDADPNDSTRSERDTEAPTQDGESSSATEEPSHNEEKR